MYSLMMGLLAGTVVATAIFIAVLMYYADGTK